MATGTAPDSSLQEVLDKGPVARMQTRMLNHKQKRFGSSAELTSEEKMRGMEIIGLPSEEQLDAILEWASELNEEQDRMIKGEIVRSTRNQAELTAQLAASEEARAESDEENQKLKLEAREDPLTGALTRRTLEKELRAKINNIDGSREEGRRSSEHNNLSILFIDVDHFKQINDTLNHKIGDAALQEFVKLLQSQLRTDDLLCRFGGEEFMVILDETSEEDAARKAEELRKVVEEQFRTLILGHCPHKIDKVGALDGTMSIGVASYSTKSPTDLSADELITRADEAMYHSKNTGRNKVTIYDPKTISPKDTKMAEEDIKS